MKVFKLIKVEIARQLENPPEVETEQSWNLGSYIQSEMDAEDKIEFRKWFGIGGGLFKKKEEGKEFWFRLIREGEEQ